MNNFFNEKLPCQMLEGRAILRERAYFKIALSTMQGLKQDSVIQGEVPGQHRAIHYDDTGQDQGARLKLSGDGKV